MPRLGIPLEKEVVGAPGASSIWREQETRQRQMRRFSEQPSRWSAFSRRHTTDTSCTKPAKRKHRRRIKTEETAKIVASVWGAEFIQFLVVLTVLQWTI